MCRQRALAGADGLAGTGALGAFSREDVAFGAGEGGAFASGTLCMAVAAPGFGAAEGVGSAALTAGVEPFASAADAAGLVELFASEAGCVAGVAETFAG